jgi:hypothetical protein
VAISGLSCRVFDKQIKSMIDERNGRGKRVENRRLQLGDGSPVGWKEGYLKAEILEELKIAGNLDFQDYSQF